MTKTPEAPQSTHHESSPGHRPVHHNPKPAQNAIAMEELIICKPLSRKDVFNFFKFFNRHYLTSRILFSMLLSAETFDVRESSGDIAESLCQ
jgi:hypothetical protein